MHSPNCTASQGHKSIDLTNTATTMLSARNGKVHVRDGKIVGVALAVCSETSDATRRAIDLLEKEVEHMIREQGM